MSISQKRAGELVLRAAEGDRAAWADLVEAYVGLIWAITRAYRLRDNDAQDVSQTTWLRLVENVDRLEDPARVGAWLATTARRECLRVLRHTRRQVLIGETDELELIEAVDSPVDLDLLRDESVTEVRAAMNGVSETCRVLMTLLMLDPPPSYEEVSAALGMPVGSIGPTRGRCLAKLRAILDKEGIAGSTRGSTT